MRVAIVGSRSLNVDISKYIPEGTTEIVSGGAQGIGRLAVKWADANGVPRLMIKASYEKDTTAPYIRCNYMVVDVSDMVVAVWDGQSHEIRLTIAYAKKVGKRVDVYMV